MSTAKGVRAGSSDVATADMIVEVDEIRQPRPNAKPTAAEFEDFSGGDTHRTTGWSLEDLTDEELVYLGRS